MKFTKIKDWFKNSNIIVSLKPKEYKLIRGGESGEVSVIGKVINSFYRQDGKKGDCAHAIALTEALALGVSDETGKITIIHVILDDCNNNTIGIICKPDSEFFKKTFKVVKK